MQGSQAGEGVGVAGRTLLLFTETGSVLLSLNCPCQLSLSFEDTIRAKAVTT